MLRDVETAITFEEWWGVQSKAVKRWMGSSKQWGRGLEPGCEGPKPRFPHQSPTSQRRNDRIGLSYSTNPRQRPGQQGGEQSLTTAGKEKGGWWRLNLVCYLDYTMWIWDNLLFLFWGSWGSRLCTGISGRPNWLLFITQVGLGMHPWVNRITSLKVVSWNRERKVPSSRRK